MSPVRVRYAPSPTGHLHLGSVRTALFNWLWARKHGGSFVLRVEDTDQDRSTQQSVDAIFDAMRWLELDWDEGPEKGGDHGPYFQTERGAIYKQFVERLINARRAYRCYCTKDDLTQARAEHKTRTGSEQGFRYPGTCRDRKDEPDLPFVVRFRAPDTGVTAWEDLVKGRIEIANETQHDAVLMRQNGLPLYNLGAAVDDISMGINLVARGDDHMINTPQQIMLYAALDEPVPQFAHMPLILAPNGEKLSKRHASVSVSDYRDMGYLPDGVLNYLARLGWSHGDQEIFSRDELIEKFDWAHVGRTGSKYDLKKFQHVQASQLRARTPQQVAQLSLPFVQARGLSVEAQDPRLAAAAEMVMPRATTLEEVAEGVDYFFRDTLVMDEKAAKKFLTADKTARLPELTSLLESVESFDRENLESRVKQWLEEHDIALKEVAQPARVALTGRKQSPGLFEVMEVLGRETTLRRLRAATVET